MPMVPMVLWSSKSEASGDRYMSLRLYVFLSLFVKMTIGKSMVSMVICGIAAVG